MSSKVQDILNRIELAAKRLGLSVEHMLDALEGKSATHELRVTATTQAPANPTTAAPTAAAVTSIPSSAPTVVAEASTTTAEAEKAVAE